MDEKKKLNYLSVAKTWYGGLRYALRTKTDPEMEQDPGDPQTIESPEDYLLAYWIASYHKFITKDL